MKRLKTIKLKNMVFFYKLSPDFTVRPIWEAVTKDAFAEKWNAEEKDTGTEVPVIERILKTVWAKDPKTKREVKAKCLEVRCEEKHATVVKNLRMARGEEDGEHDLGRFVPHSFPQAMKFEIIRNQNAFNASVRGMKVDGIHKDADEGRHGRK
jgi:hypothetical protein